MNRKLAVLVVTGLLAAVPVAATKVNFNSGRSRFQLSASDAVVNMNLSDNVSSVAVEDDRLVIGGHNFSIANGTAQPIQVHMHAWNVDAATSPLLNFTANTTASHNVTFGLSGLAADTNFTVTKDDNFYRQVASNAKGNISFFIDTWSLHTITVESADTTDPSVSLSLGSTSIDTGGSVKVSCSASDDSGIKSTALTVTDPDGATYTPSCGQKFSKTSVAGTYSVTFNAKDNAGNTNSVTKSFDASSSTSSGGGSGGSSLPTVTDGWVGMNRSQYTLVDSQDRTGIKRVAVNIDRRLNDFRLRVKQLDTEPTGIAPVSRSYRYWEITQQGTTDDRIINTTITFEVNESFATRFDRVALARFTEDWDELPTQLVNDTGETWLYRATAPRFSYFTAVGVDDPAPANETTDGNETNDTVQEPASGCGNGICELNETWKSCQQDCSKPVPVIQAEEAIEEAEMWIGPGDTGYDLLEQARKSYDAGNYTAAQQQAENALQSFRSSQGKEVGLPNVKKLSFIIVAVFLIMIGLAYWMGRGKSSDKKREEVSKEEVSEEEPADKSEPIEEEEENEFVCPVCGESFENEHGLEVHEGMEHGSSDGEEPEADSGGEESAEDDDDGSESFVCPECGESFDSEHGLAVHEGMEH